MSYSSSGWNMLNLPDEILVEIISYLNARERLALGNLCEKFTSLVFGEKKLLKDLNFSEECYFSSMVHVQQYFNDKRKYEHIRKININNIDCTKPAKMLQTIGKAKNLVDVHMIGLKFKDIKQLGSFLESLECLKKLSVDWPTVEINDILCCKVLERPFSKLLQLTLMLYDVKYNKTLIHTLELCQKLQELRLLQTNECFIYREEDSPVLMPKKLKNLRLAACCGYNTDFLQSLVVGMLPAPEQWTKFQPYNTMNTNYFYFEKNLQVFQELEGKVPTDINPYTESPYNVGWFLFFECLLKEVIQLTDQRAREKFCCLSNHVDQYSCLLKIEDAKSMLKNPRHKISYLCLNHNIEPECDVHIVALVFPGLTKLVLSNIIQSKTAISKEYYLESGSKRKRTSFEGYKNQSVPNSSFKKLVGNTPYLKDLTLRASALKRDEVWDLGALYLISNWKNLTALYLENLPIRNGQFLVDIGRQCKNLEKLRLKSLGPRGSCCYKNDLLQMLVNCHNLKDFSMQQDNLGQVHPVFTTLTENQKLRRVCVKILGGGNTVDNLLSSIEKLARSRNLILLVCKIEGLTQVTCKKLRSILQRLKHRSGHSTFQFEINRGCDGLNYTDKPVDNFGVHSVHKDLLLPFCFNDSLYRLDF